MEKTNAGKLLEEIRNTIDHFVREFDVTSIEILGALEVVKYVVLLEIEKRGIQNGSG